MTKEDIRKGNDLFRNTLIQSSRHKLFLTEMVQGLEDEKFQELITKLREFKEFDKDNDTYKEHDFGAIDLDNEKYFFKIDYYDKNLEYGFDFDSDEPINLVRVLTLMHASEY
jgi:hypothetical protein